MSEVPLVGKQLIAWSPQTRGGADRGDRGRNLRPLLPRLRALAVRRRRHGTQREVFIDHLLVRIHCIIVMIRWTGLAPWEFEFPFPGSLTSTFSHLGRCTAWCRHWRGSTQTSTTTSRAPSSPPGPAPRYSSYVRLREIYVCLREIYVRLREIYVRLYVEVVCFAPRSSS